jgi:hypothetical protein
MLPALVGQAAAELHRELRLELEHRDKEILVEMGQVALGMVVAAAELVVLELLEVILLEPQEERVLHLQSQEHLFIMLVAAVAATTGIQLDRTEALVAAGHQLLALELEQLDNMPQVVVAVDQGLLLE